MRGFAPDLDQTTEGILLKGSKGVVPTLRGVQAAPSAVDTANDTVSGTAVGAASIVKLNGSTRTFVGTGSEIFELDGTSWTQRGSGYTATNARFAQFGDTTIAALGKTDILQASSATTFADLATAAPAANIVEVANNQVMAFDTSEATFGDSPDRWFVSAINAPADWVPSIATQSASGRLIKTPGAIKAARRLGDEVMAYKDTSIYRGRYVGGAIVWQWILISDEIGAPSQESVVTVDTFQVFPSRDDFYIFDGSRPKPIGGPIKEFFFMEELDQDSRDQIEGVNVRDISTVRFHYPSSASGGRLDRFIDYNYRTNQWGAPTDLSAEAALELIAATGPTYNTLGDFYSTYNDLPEVAYDATFWTATTRKPAIIQSSDLKTVDGAGVDARMIINDIGDDSVYSFAKRIRPRYIVNPTSATLTNSYRDNLGDALASSDATASLSNGKFDFERESRWHRFRHDTSGNMEITGHDIDISEAGLE